jgi:putative DNA primase/helicase
MQTPNSGIKDLAVGRWRSILPVFGVPAKFLDGKHQACPLCGGKDRARFDDKGGNGTYFCGQCGPGDGVALVMKLNGWTFIEAVRKISAELPTATVAPPKAKTFDAARQFDIVASLWRNAYAMTGNDTASLYLANRGIDAALFRQVKWTPRAKYWHEDKTKTEHPAMVAHFVSPDASSATLHFTYLTPEGRKVPKPMKERKMYPSPIPKGGAVRLANSAETMGIAEGVETAMSAMMLFDIPVWAVISAGNMLKWVPPKTAKHVIIFGDADKNYVGQSAAYGAAHSLSVQGITVEVRIPDSIGDDWNDVLMSGKGVP